MQINKDIKGQIQCFIDNCEMEFIVSDILDKNNVTFKCPVCEIIYLIPANLIGNKIQLKGNLI